MLIQHTALQDVVSELNDERRKCGELEIECNRVQSEVSGVLMVLSVLPLRKTVPLRVQTPIIMRRKAADSSTNLATAQRDLVTSARDVERTRVGLTRAQTHQQSDYRKWKALRIEHDQARSEFAAACDEEDKQQRAASATSLRAKVSNLIQQRGGSDSPRVCVLGWLNELARIKDHRHATAVNAALKRSGNNVVVQSRTDAIELIAHVRTAKVGVVSCDVLDDVTKQPVPSSPKGVPLVPLIDCLEVAAPRFEPLFRVKLALWFFADRSDKALELSKRHKVNVVTALGEVFLGDGTR